MGIARTATEILKARAFSPADSLSKASDVLAALRSGVDDLRDGKASALPPAGRARPRSAERGLTPAERRVAERVAAGATNRQVAQDLFRSEKAIETHLASVNRKLAIHSRGRLPDALAPGSGHLSSGKISGSLGVGRTPNSS